MRAGPCLPLPYLTEWHPTPPCCSPHSPGRNLPAASALTHVGGPTDTLCHSPCAAPALPQSASSSLPVSTQAACVCSVVRGEGTHCSFHPVPQRNPRHGSPRSDPPAPQGGRVSAHTPPAAPSTAAKPRPQVQPLPPPWNEEAKDLRSLYLSTLSRTRPLPAEWPVSQERTAG